MSKNVQLGKLGIALGLAVLAVILTMTSLAAVRADGQPDLMVEIKAPRHIAPSSTFQVNILYANVGSADAPEAWVTATLPAGTQFITATDRAGAPLPPDTVDGPLLAWNVGPLPVGSCVLGQHILITQQASPSLTEGQTLTHSAVIASSAVESNTLNNADSVTSVVSIMAQSIKRVHAQTVMPADVLTYTLALRLAHGPGINTRLVELSDTLPFSHQVRFLGWTSTVSGSLQERQRLHWQGRVQAGKLITLQYQLGVEGTVTPGTVLTNVARLRWQHGQFQLGPVTTVVTLPHDAHMFGPGGEQWHHQHGVTLTVPPQAVSETTRFQFRPLFTDTPPLSSPPGQLFAHRAFELTAFRFGQNVHQFSQPLTLTLNYSGAAVAGLQRETLRLWHRAGSGEPWAMLGEPARVMSGALAFTTTHLSQFALFGEAKHHLYLPLLLRW